MPAPSISGSQDDLKPIWRGCSLEDVQEWLRRDVAELTSLYRELAEDAVAAAELGRQPNYRIRLLIKAWEHTQDVHWSWYREMQNVSTGAAEGFAPLGNAVVGQGN